MKTVETHTSNWLRIIDALRTSHNELCECDGDCNDLKLAAKLEKALENNYYEVIRT